jgi:membrane protein
MRTPHITAFARLMHEAWLEYQRDQAGYFAVAMIYFALVSLVPLVLLLFASVGLILRFSPAAADASHQLLLGVETTLGSEVTAAIEHLLGTLQQDSIVASAISTVGAFATAAGLFRHLRSGFRAIWKHDPPLVSGSLSVIIRATAREHAIAFAIVLGGGGLLLVALAIIAATQMLNAVVGSVSLIGQAAGWLLTGMSSVVLAAIVFAPLFKILPPVSVRWRDVFLAAIVCAVGWVVAAELLMLYGLFVGDHAGPYAAIGGALALLLWMKMLSQLLFFGAEVCKVVSLRAGAEIVPVNNAG